MKSESVKKQRLRIAKIIFHLKKEYPNSKWSLIYDNPFQLLVATILSAQCTDERVNKVTSIVFKKYPELVLNKTDEHFPGAKFVSDRQICLPLYPGLTDDELMYVVDSLKSVLESLN